MVHLLLCFMLFHVQHQVTFDRKTFNTKLTAIFPLLRVDNLDMSHHITSIVKRSRASRASVRPFFCVTSYMIDQSRPLRKTFVAIFTGIRRLSRVDFKMGFQTIFLSKTFTANVACMGFEFRVNF